MVDAAGNVPPTNMTVVALPRVTMQSGGEVEACPELSLLELGNIITAGVYGIRNASGELVPSDQAKKKMDMLVVFLILGGCHTWTAYSKLMKVCIFIGACTGISNLTQ